MELKARKRNAPVEPSLGEVNKIPPRINLPAKTGQFQYMIAIRCNSMLYNTIQNMLTASHASQDFTYTSVTDFIRHSLEAYREGMVLTELEEKGEKMFTTMRVDRVTRDFYRSLPDRMRVKILERAIRTFLKQQR